MSTARIRLVLILAATAVNAALMAVPGAERAYACSCAGEAAPLQDLKLSDKMFVGKVV